MLVTHQASSFQQVNCLVHCVSYCRFNYEGISVQVESGATGLMLQLVTLPPPVGISSNESGYLSLLRRLLSITIRACTRNQGRAWLVELVSIFSSS